MKLEQIDREHIVADGLVHVWFNTGRKIAAK